MGGAAGLAPRTFIFSLRAEVRLLRLGSWESSGGMVLPTLRDSEPESVSGLAGSGDSLE